MAEALSSGGLREVLGAWGEGEGPLYRRLARAVDSAIAAGRIPAGAVLPPERHLAGTLGVSRSTVVAALESLKQAGTLEARQGSGTWVRGPHRLPDEGNRALVEQLEGHAVLRDLTGAPSHSVEFTAAAVDCAPEVITASTSLDPADVARWSVSHGYNPLGLDVMRQAVADRLTSIGLPSTPQQVLITTGATEALLLAARLYLEPGAPAVLETPSYAGAIDVLHAVGARLLSVDVDASGARTDQLADVLARALPRLVYLVPDFQNPTGLVLSQRRREEVARLAGEFHVPVIEDIVQRELWLDEPPPPPIASFAPDAPVLTVGSMSKVFWGGLRLGWIRGSETTIGRLGRMKAVTDFGTPLIAQMVSAQLLPQIDSTAQRRRAELGERLEVLTRAVAEHLPDWHCPRPAGGMSVWAQLPTPRAEELVRRATGYGVAVVPGSTFAVDHHRHTDRIRLPFVAPPVVIEEGIRRLAGAWASLDTRGARPSSPALVV